jgi:23S rRNA (uracil747-C5)-methyltransferase
LAQLRAALPWLQAQLPQLKVITANIQPVHMAIMEGEQEIFFTEQQALGRSLTGAAVDPPAKLLSDQPGGSQPAVRHRPRLGARAAGPAYVGSVLRRRGFGLHCATPAMRLTGIEIAPEAIACASSLPRSWGSAICIFRRWTPRSSPP